MFYFFFLKNYLAKTSYGAEAPVKFSKAFTKFEKTPNLQYNINIRKSSILLNFPKTTETKFTSKMEREIVKPCYLDECANASARLPPLFHYAFMEVLRRGNISKSKDYSNKKTKI